MNTKMLKETEETIGSFVTFLSLMAFQLAGPGPSDPHAWLHLGTTTPSLLNQAL